MIIDKYIIYYIYEEIDYLILLSTYNCQCISILVKLNTKFIFKEIEFLSKIEKDLKSKF